MRIANVLPFIGHLFFMVSPVYNTHVFRFLYTRKEEAMRTNIVLDDKLIERAQKLTGIKTKREVVHEALRLLILLNEQAEIRNLRGKLPWDGSLSDQRKSRIKEK
jgi:Arc/MetJ family transcription regulator